MGLDQRANAAFAAPGARQGNLLADNGEVVARVVVDPNGQGYVQGTALIALDDGQAYQLWSLDTGQPVSLGLLGRNPSTSAFASNANASRLALSIEPVSGSTQPTSKPIAVAELR